MIDQVLPPAQAPVVSAAIFKAYDIRGIVETALTEEAVSAIGLALGAKARARGIGQVVVGRDGRLSGPALARALSAGLCAAGVDVIDIGMVPTPLVYFATVLTGCGTGVAVTGSHNPPEYNGLKMMLGGATLHGEESVTSRPRWLIRHVMRPCLPPRRARCARWMWCLTTSPALQAR